MIEKINDKLKEIEEYLEELESFLPSTFEQYEQNLEKKAACERYFEKLVEAAVDLAFLILKEEGLSVSEEDEDAFDLLVKERIINAELATKLKEAKGMRNILAHEYGIVDDTIVYTAVTEEIIQDLEQFLERIGRYLQKKGKLAQKQQLPKQQPL